MDGQISKIFLGEEKKVEGESIAEESKTEEKSPTDIYDEQSIVFVDPNLIFDLNLSQCLTPKISLPALIAQVDDPCRCLLSLLNRTRSKTFFLNYLGRMMVQSKLTVIECSKIFMRMNSVYRQANIE